MIFWFIVKSIIWFLYKLVFQVKIEGVKNIPKNGGGLICPNHVHFLDGPLVVVALNRRVNTMSKAEAFKPAPLAWLMKKMGCFPVQRDKRDFGSLKKCITMLKNGELVTVFPEGTRNGLEKGKKLGKGAAFLLMSSKVPLIPVGITGKYKPFGKLKIKFGEPVMFEEFYGMEKDKDIYDKVNEKILLNIQNQLTN